MLKTLTYSVLLSTSLFLSTATTHILAANNIEEVAADSIEISEKISINQSTNEQLASIKGIGSQKAQAIINYRETNGDFVDIKELVKVKGIGQSTLQKITPFISL